MQYDDLLLKLYASPPTPGSAQSTTHYQAQVLAPSSLGGGRFNITLTTEELQTLQRPVEGLRDFARYGPAGWHDLEYQYVEDAVGFLANKLHASLPEELRQAIGREATAARQRGHGLRLGLLIDPRAADLAGLPWEMLGDHTWPGGYLALSAYSPVVRLVETVTPPRPWGASDRRPVRSNDGARLLLGLPRPAIAACSVLVVMAGVTPDSKVAGAEEEARIIREVLDPGADVRVLEPPVSFARFAAELDTRPYDIIHIITHGGVDLASDLAFLLFDPDTPSGAALADAPSEQVIATRLATVLASQPHLELLVLSACRSGDPRGAGAAPGAGAPLGGGVFTASLAPHLAATTGIAVVAMQFDILAPSAAMREDPTRSWAAAFYRQLGRGEGVEGALATARRALALDKEPVLWAAPVLYVPLYWPGPPVALYQTLDRALYRAVATLQEGDGLMLQEGLLMGGLLLAAGLLMQGLFGLPADPADLHALTSAGIALVLLTAGLPLLIAPGVLLLLARRRPALLPFRPVSVLIAYGGGGFGVVTALAGVGVLALVAHALGLAHPLLTALLRLLTLVGVVTCGLVFSGRFVGVFDSVTDTPRVRRGDLVIGLGAVVIGCAAALELPLFYPLLVNPQVGVGLLAAAFLFVAFATLRPAGTPAQKAPRAAKQRPARRVKESPAPRRRVG